MNLLDLILVLVLAAALASGLRMGFVARAASLLGVIAGVLLATWSVPTALSVAERTEPGVRLLVGLVVLAVTVTAVATVFQAVGMHLRRSVAASGMSTLDRGAGAVVSVVTALALVWFLVPAAADVPGPIARQARGSAIVQALTTLAPPPDTVRALRNLVDDSRFPEVFHDLRPAPVTGPPPEQIPISAEVVERATASTSHIEADGCGRQFAGSGFAVAPGTVVTNAHVVAGADRVRVRRPDGTVLDATVVVFDGARDLAVLEVPNLGQEPLGRATGDVGDTGVVIGYPGGQHEPRVAPSEIRDRRTAVGRDIYGRAPTERQVLFLAASLQQGDSGSPVIDAEGRVSGVVFAISPDQPTTSFALDIPELEAALAAPRAPGETGPCI